MGSVTSQDYNLIENTAGCTIGGTVTHHVTGLPPQIDPLADNGGPTYTQALQAGSPAIDRGPVYRSRRRPARPIPAFPAGLSR